MTDLWKYLSFSGRSTRGEFWAIQLIMVVIGAMTGGFVLFMVSTFNSTNEAAIGVTILLALPIFLATILLHWATIVRRIRDFGSDPLWCLLLFVPFIGTAAFFIFGLLPTKEDK